MILDLGLPDGDGKDVIRQVRQWSQVPIIVLSAREREAEKIEALDLGADDFVNKPFGVGELMARLRTALRHRRQTQGEATVVRIGALEIDMPRRRVARAGAEIKLTSREFDLLSCLARHPGKVMTHRQLLTAVWGPAHVAGYPVSARLHRAAAPEDRGRPRRSEDHPDRARHRLPARGGLIGSV